jgi:hypothetical protein
MPAMPRRDPPDFSPPDWQLGGVARLAHGAGVVLVLIISGLVFASLIGGMLWDRHLSAADSAALLVGGTLAVVVGCVFGAFNTHSKNRKLRDLVRDAWRD